MKKGISPFPHFSIFNFQLSILNLLHFPDVEGDAAACTETGLAKEEAFVHPGVLAVLGGLELGGATEIHAALAAHLDYAAVAYVYAHTVIGTDTVDGLNLGAAVALHLVVCAAGKNLTLDVGTLECAACDGDDRAGTLAGIAYCEGLAQGYVETYHILKFRSFRLTILLLLGCAESELCVCIH